MIFDVYPPMLHPFGRSSSSLLSDFWDNDDVLFADPWLTSPLMHRHLLHGHLYPFARRNKNDTAIQQQIQNANPLQQEKTSSSSSDISSTGATTTQQPINISNDGGAVTSPSTIQNSNNHSQLAHPQHHHQLATFSRRTPRFEVHDSKEALVLRAETPGMPKENLKVVVQENRLTISGEENQEQRSEDGGFYMRSFGSFERSWTLPSHVDGEQLTANYNDGVLEVRLPKKAAPEQPKPREITISS